MSAVGRRLLGLQPGEGSLVGWAAGMSFSILASQYALRPVRDAMGLAGHTRDLPRLFLFTLAGTLLVAPIVTALVTRLPRRTFLAAQFRGTAVTFAAFYAALQGDAPGVFAARAFFVWASVVNLVVVSVGWGFLADVFRREQGARLFGLVAAGGTAGALAGSLLAATLAPAVGAAPLLLVAAAFLEVAVRCAHRIAAPEGGAPVREGGVLRWLAALARSPFLAGLVAYMLLFTTTSTFAYLDQARIVKEAVASTAARTALFARVDLAVNLVSLALQSAVVGPLVARLGLGATLALLPAASAAGFAALRAWPTLAVLVAFQVVRRGLDYGVAKPAREVLFTVVPTHDKYKAKSFIDTFVYRGGDAAAAWIHEAASPVLGVALVPLTLPLCAAWAALAWSLGRTAVRTPPPP